MAEHRVFTSQASAGPTPAMPAKGASRVWTKSYRTGQPRSFRPTRMMCPPTHSMATVPMTVMNPSTLGMALTSISPNFWDPAESLRVRCRPMSSIFTIRATAPYTRTVMAMATTTRIRARTMKSWSATSFMEMTMISQERMKSVVMAPLTTLFSASGPFSMAGLDFSGW